jgi:hypothetical protein
MTAETRLLIEEDRMTDDPVKVRWLKLAKDGSVGGQVDELFDVPQLGENLTLDGRLYRVEGKIETPKLDCHCHFLLSER